MATKPNPLAPDTMQTWLAAALAWITNRIHATQTDLAHQSTTDQIGQRMLVFGPDRILAIAQDPPARVVTFDDLRSFAEFVALHAATPAERHPGPSAYPWTPAVLVGPKLATFTADPYGHTVARLNMIEAPAFTLLERLEAKQEWQTQKAVYDLARLDLAAILDKNFADTLAAAAFRVTSTVARTVGTTTDRGVRQYQQEQAPADDGKPGPKMGDFPVTCPVFVWADPTTETGRNEARATLRLDLAHRLDDEGAPEFRLAPMAGQARLARLEARAVIASYLRGHLANLAQEALPVFIGE